MVAPLRTEFRYELQSTVITKFYRSVFSTDYLYPIVLGFRPDLIAEVTEQYCCSLIRIRRRKKIYLHRRKYGSISFPEKLMSRDHYKRMKMQIRTALKLYPHYDSHTTDITKTPRCCSQRYILLQQIDGLKITQGC